MPIPNRTTTQGPAPAEWASIAAILAAYAALVWRFRAFFTDDASISLRYARHLALGLGARWNPADPAPTEGFSNPALVFLEAGWAALGGDPQTAATAQGIGFGALAVLATWWWGRRLAGPAAALVAAAIVGLYAGVPFWSLGGLETTAALFFVTVGSLRYVAGAAPLGVGLTWAVLPWIRPEGAAYVLPLVVAGELARRWERGPEAGSVTARRLLGLLGPFVVSVGALTALRLVWFGHVLPNPVIVKVASGEVGPTTLRFLQDAWPVVALAAVGLGVLRGPVRMLGVTLVVQVVISLSFSDIVNNWSRLLLPAWGLWALVAGSALVRIVGAAPARWIPAAATVLTLLAVATPASWSEAAAFADRYRDCRIAVREETATWIRGNIPPDEVYAIADAGVVPYLAEGRALDIFGLNDPRVQTTGAESWKDRAASIMADEPAWIVLTSKSVTKLQPRNKVEQRIQDHPEFKRYTRAATADGMRCGYSLLVYRRGDGPPSATTALSPEPDVALSAAPYE